MAGMTGHIEGKKKLAVWLAFDKMRKNLRHWDADEEVYAGGFYLIFPRTKKEAFKAMKKKRK